MGTIVEETVGQVLERIAVAGSTNDTDWRMMQALLHRCGWKRARVVYGVVYLEGRGTIEAPPCSVQAMARMLLHAADR